MCTKVYASTTLFLFIIIIIFFNFMQSIDCSQSKMCSENVLILYNINCMIGPFVSEKGQSDPSGSLGKM